VVVQVGTANASVRTGLVVSAAEGLVDIFPDDIEEAPDFTAHVRPCYALGCARFKGIVHILLDVERMLDDLTISSPPTCAWKCIS
jgi:chemotaxis signal transduction protein